jgi:hypothetical protein
MCRARRFARVEDGDQTGRPLLPFFSEQLDAFFSRFGRSTASVSF